MQDVGVVEVEKNVNMSKDRGMSRLLSWCLIFQLQMWFPLKVV
jgi:hypothetical protein